MLRYALLAYNHLDAPFKNAKIVKIAKFRKLSQKRMAKTPPSRLEIDPVFCGSSIDTMELINEFLAT